MSLPEALRRVMLGQAIGQFPPNLQTLKKDRKLEFRENLLFALGRARHDLAFFGREDVLKLFTYLMKDDTFLKLTDKSGKLLDEFKLKDRKGANASGALDWNKAREFAQGNIDKENDANVRAAEIRRIFRGKLVSKITFSVDYKNPARWADALKVINTLNDPFAWTAILTGNNVFQPYDPDATWASVAIEGGTLLLDILPATHAFESVESGGKAAKREVKSSKAMFKKTASLPEARAIREVEVEEATVCEHCIGGSCFVAGTTVLTSHGWVPIEKVHAGEQVYARNPATGSTGFRRVTATFTNQNTDLVTVVAHQGSTNADVSITGTTGHPVWVNHAWREMLNIKPGDQLTTESGLIATVVNSTVTHQQQPTITYNFNVAEWHTYFVSSSTSQVGVWVHNGQQIACDAKWSNIKPAWNEVPEADRIARFKAGGDLEHMAPHQKYALATVAEDGQIARPAATNLGATIPPDYDLSKPIWEGNVKVQHKSAGWIDFKDGFADYKERAGEGLSDALKPKGSPIVTIDFAYRKGGDTAAASAKDISRAWAESNYLKNADAAEKVFLEEKYTWHHSTNVYNGKVEMNLVPRIIHTPGAGGPKHAGGMAVIKFLIDNDIPF